MTGDDLSRRRTIYKFTNITLSQKFLPFHGKIIDASSVLYYFAELRTIHFVPTE